MGDEQELREAIATPHPCEHHSGCTQPAHPIRMRVDGYELYQLRWLCDTHDPRRNDGS